MYFVIVDLSGHNIIHGPEEMLQPTMQELDTDPEYLYDFFHGMADQTSLLSSFVSKYPSLNILEVNINEPFKRKEAVT